MALILASILLQTSPGKLSELSFDQAKRKM